MQFRKKLLYKVIFYQLFLFTAFCISYIYSSAYLFGDQIFYRDLYFSLADASLYEVFDNQSFYTGSSEPLYGLIAWAGAKLGVEKDVYFSIINSLLCLFLLRFLLENSASKLYVFLAFLNYYIFVLLGPAERLKVAFLFMFMAIILTSLKLRLALAVAAFFSHFQMLILLGSSSVGLITQVSYRNFSKTKYLAIISIGGIALLILFGWFYSIFSSVLVSKYESYHEEHGVLSIFNIAILAFISIAILKRKLEALFALAATAVAASLVGPERVNMIAFILFSYYVVNERRTGHPVVIALMVYFAVKGIIFSIDVFRYGTGF